MLLTELHYLVNIYGQNGKLAEITYSGVFNSTKIYAGNTKIPIEDISYYLYCNKVCSGLNLMFPCWIIFRRSDRVSEGNKGRGNGPAQERGN